VKTKGVFAAFGWWNMVFLPIIKNPLLSPKQSEYYVCL